MLIELLRKFSPTRTLVLQLGKNRDHYFSSKILHHLKKGTSVLDIGAGMCDIDLTLQKSGIDVTPLDIKNLSFIPQIRPIIYDGQTVPFADKSFDVALVCTVLHHTPDPDTILKEAKRVAKKIIIVEDVYNSSFHKYVTYFFDSLLNFEFFGHPHSNRNDTEWRQTFKDHGLKLEKSVDMSTYMVFKHKLYVLAT